MIIIQIRKIKQNYLITFDNQKSLTVTEDIIVKFRLVTGKKIEDISVIEEALNEGKLYNKAMRHASFGKSENQMISYLENEGVDGTEEIITKLKKDKVINDVQFINQLKRKGYGYLKFKEKLNHYRFSQEDIKQALATYDDSSALEKAYKLAEKKFAAEKVDKQRQKIYRHLLSLGFTEEKIMNRLNG